MKKSILIVLLSCVCFGIGAQRLYDGTDLSTSMAVNYIDVWLSKSGLGKKTYYCSVNYGAKRASTPFVEGEKGVVFNNAIDMLNFWAKNGWEYIGVYEERSGGFRLKHYYFKRK
jgi:hypothetical protein